MKKFSKREIAGVLACMSFFGNKTSAMNQSEVKNLGNIDRAGEMASGNKNLKDKVPVPPKGLPKKFYPLWIALSALGLSAVVILGILGIKKLCSKDSGDQGKTPNGIFYQGLGNFGRIEELKNAWESEDVIGKGVLGKNSPIGKELVELRTDKKEFGEFLDRDHSEESELAKLKIEYINGTTDSYPFSNCAEIRFDDKYNFECYDNKGKKLKLLQWERSFIDYIAKYTKEKLGILPCLVHYDGKHCFYFRFSLDASNKEFREDKLINFGEHTSLKLCFGTHISCSEPDILCDLEVWRKKTS